LKSGGLVKITRKALKIFCMCAVVSSTVSFAGADQIYAPDILWERHIAEKTGAVEIADTHLGIPYRDDGALDSRGYFTTFSSPEKVLDSPGLNCSGLVVSAARFLFNKNFTLEEVTRDRLGNSGDNASLGKDWDFGWDLVLNLTDGRKQRIIMPDARNHPVEGQDGTTLRGFDLHNAAAWRNVLSQMQAGRIYLGSISRPANKRGYKLLHYHVVLMIPDAKGGVWLYHSTRRSNVHRMNIASPQGMNRFMSQFQGARGETKDVLVVEAVLPDLDSGSETVEDAAPGADASPQSGPQGAPSGPPPAGTAEKRSEPEPSHPQAVASESPAGPSAQAAVPTQPQGPQLVLNHLAGKVFKAQPGLVTGIPRFSDETKTGVMFSYQNWGKNPRDLEINLRGPGGDLGFKGKIPAQGQQLAVVYPRDFGDRAASALRQGDYQADVMIDGVHWSADVFEVARQREALPKILNVKVPAVVQAGKAFTVSLQAENKGAESDYGGITVSSPDSSGLKLVSAKSGRVYPSGSTVLSVTSDKIRSKVPMAERWIEVWGENKIYDMEVQIQAGRPGTYPLYVRCALRGVNVKSSVILMDPAQSQAVDQQGFPVYVYQITVR